MAAHLAYSLPSRGASSDGFTVADLLKFGSHVAVVLDEPDMCTIAFRGTDDRADWHTNLNILFRTMPWGGVHRGFHDAAMLFWPDIDRHVRRAKNAGQRVWLAGHSLGGALATITAAKALCNDPTLVEGLCTFGQPVVAGLPFRRKIDAVLGQRYIRVVNHTDAVADLPSPLTLRVHAGCLWYLDIDGQLHHTKSLGRGLKDAWLAPRRLGGLSQFVAHRMADYVGLHRTLLQASGARVAST